MSRRVTDLGSRFPSNSFILPKDLDSRSSLETWTAHQLSQRDTATPGCHCGPGRHRDAHQTRFGVEDDEAVFLPTLPVGDDDSATCSGHRLRTTSDHNSSSANPTRLGGALRPSLLCYDPDFPHGPQKCPPVDDDEDHAKKACQLSTLPEASMSGYNLTPITYNFIPSGGLSIAKWENRFLEAYKTEQRVAIALVRTLTYMYFASSATRIKLWKLNGDVNIVVNRMLGPHRASMEYWFGPYKDSSFLKVFGKYDRMYRHKDIVMVTNDWSNYPVPGKKPMCTSAFWGANNFLPNNDRWIWLCSEWATDFLGLTNRWTNLMHEMSHVSHYADDAGDARSLVVKGDIATALKNNLNYDTFAYNFFLILTGKITGTCWTPHSKKL